MMQQPMMSMMSMQEPMMQQPVMSMQALPQPMMQPVMQPVMPPGAIAVNHLVVHHHEPSGHPQYPVHANEEHAPTQWQRLSDVEHCHWVHGHSRDKPAFRVWADEPANELGEHVWGTEVQRPPMPMYWNIHRDEVQKPARMGAEADHAVDLGGVGANSYFFVDTPVMKTVPDDKEHIVDDDLMNVHEAFGEVFEDAGGVVQDAHAVVHTEGQKWATRAVEDFDRVID